MEPKNAGPIPWMGDGSGAVVGGFRALFMAVEVTPGRSSICILIAPVPTPIVFAPLFESISSSLPFSSAFTACRGHEASEADGQPGDGGQDEQGIFDEPAFHGFLLLAFGEGPSHHWAQRTHPRKHGTEALVNGGWGRGNVHVNPPTRRLAFLPLCSAKSLPMPLI